MIVRHVDMVFDFNRLMQRIGVGKLRKILNRILCILSIQLLLGGSFVASLDMLMRVVKLLHRSVPRVVATFLSISSRPRFALFGVNVGGSLSMPIVSAIKRSAPNSNSAVEEG